MPQPPMTSPSNRWLQARSVSGDAYDATYTRRAAAGEDVHGEANFVERFAPRSVLDAGCGTGRVGRELARRGLDVVGVDLDPEMLATARRSAPDVPWHLDDLETVALARTFDVIVMAGNVMIFLTPGTEGAVLNNMARHVRPGGWIIAGFQLIPGRLSIERYDELAADAGLVIHQRWSTWDGDPWHAGSDYGGVGAPVGHASPVSRHATPGPAVGRPFSPGQRALLLTVGAVVQVKANSEPRVVFVTATAVPGPVPTRTPYASYVPQGEVLDAHTEQPIPAAVVFLDGHPMAKGSFRFTIPVDQKTVLRVEAEGYEPVELGITGHLLNDGKTLTAPIRMRPRGVRLD